MLELSKLTDKDMSYQRYCDFANSFPLDNLAQEGFVRK